MVAERASDSAGGGLKERENDSKFGFALSKRSKAGKKAKTETNKTKTWGEG